MTSSAKTNETLAEWQEKLLQLDKRNNLLYFKRGGRVALRIEAQNLDEFYNKLIDAKEGLSFDYAEKRQRKKLYQDNEFSVGEGVSQNDEIFVKPGEIKVPDLQLLQLQTRLRSLRRRGQEWLSEQGVNVLYLAFGIVQWYDDFGQLTSSPLLMLPCTLDQASERDNMYLSVESEDIQPNITLSFKLRMLGYDLPAWTDESTIESYFDLCREQFAKNNWQIDNELYISTFSYSKVAMWQDLEDMKVNGTDHKFVLQLAGQFDESEIESANRDFQDSRDELKQGEQDYILSPEKRFEILESDFSQSNCAMNAGKGNHLIIQGPPGTGKSQTIANLIASALAENKSVLFVSEKTAALDVVKRRLERCDLGTFCLDLHSERGKKANVYIQLGRAMEDPQELDRDSESLEALAEIRHRLNTSVKVLHERRLPLDYSIFEIHGIYARVQGFPDVRFSINHKQYYSDQLTKQSFAKLTELAERIERLPEQFRVHDESIWKGLKSELHPITLSDDLKRFSADLQNATELLRTSGAECSAELGISQPTSLAEAKLLSELLEKIARRPTKIFDHWLDAKTSAELLVLTQKFRNYSTEYSNLRRELAPFLPKIDPSVNYEALRQNLREICLHAIALEKLLGNNWQISLLSSPTDMLSNSELLNGSLQKVQSLAVELSKILCKRQPLEFGEIESLATTAKAILELGLLPAAWFDVNNHPRIKLSIEKILDQSQQIHQLREELFCEFNEEVLAHVNQAMLVRFRTDHQNKLTRFFSASFKEDMRVLKGYYKGNSKLDADNSITHLESIVKLQNLESKLEDLITANASFFEGLDSRTVDDWGRVKAHFESLTKNIDDNELAYDVVLPFTTNTKQRSSLESLIREIRDSTKLLTKNFDDSNFVVSWRAEKLQLLSELVITHANCLRLLLSGTKHLKDQSPSFDHLLQLFEKACSLCSLEEVERVANNELSNAFASLYSGFDTEWQTIEESISWCQSFMSMREGQITPQLRVILSEAKRFDHNSWLPKLSDQIASFVSARDHIDALFETTSTPASHLDSERFSKIEARCKTMFDSADKAPAWLTYRQAQLALNDELGSDIISSIRKVTDRSADVPKIIQKRLLADWLQYQYDQHSELKHFAVTEHNHLLEKFKHLDKDLLPASRRNEIRRRLFHKLNKEFPNSGWSPQRAILNGELAKQKKRLSIRKLIAKIPGFIQTLKPCFMMSPLSVSQHLPMKDSAGTPIMFDVVIFDEASQVCPEDAVPAIARAQQLIVVGDDKQLPPTSFFKRAASDESDYSDDDEDEEVEEVNALKDTKSILSAMRRFIGRGLEEKYLRTHYRSKHEDLIRFSNEKFYNNRLIIFPSPANESESGISDCFLEDGRFDAGGQRINKLEARKIVDIVFDHMRTKPSDQSIGVVTFSRPQADYVFEEIRQRRLAEPDLEERFSETIDEPFFVKNLENVQGDERDHIILGLGYGKSVATGIFNNRFGPIANPGGEFRLNVAITRARTKLSVVHSIRATDIVSDKPGPILLREFLEYIENPSIYFETRSGNRKLGQSYFAFEDAVHDALQSRGHILRKQVGVAGYSIDLVVLGPDGSSDLAIECDGYTYHNSPAARDRDWLRKSILEKLGWSVHRVWSTSWVRDPEKEMSDIEEALAIARCKKNSLSIAGSK